MTTAIVPGSLGAMAQGAGTSLAEAFLGADVLVLVDVSGSMATPDSRGGQRRYDVACSELRKLQAEMPGKVGVIAFSGNVEFCPGGVPPLMAGNTDLAAALRFAQPADGTVRFIIVSDGEPDAPGEALRVAGTFKSRLDTVYVGPESERGGADFLRRLAAASGGRHVVADRAMDLAAATQGLLAAAR